MKNIKGFLVLSDLLNPVFVKVAKKILTKSQKIIKSSAHTALRFLEKNDYEQKINFTWPYMMSKF